MKDLIKIELKKIINRKAIFITFLFMLAINIVYFILFDYWWNDTYILEDGGTSIEAVKGKEAIDIDRKIGQSFSGILDEKQAKEINHRLDEIEKKYSGYGENQRFLLMNKYRNQRALVERYQKDYKSLENIKIGYCTGWSKFVIGFSNVITICLGGLIIVGAANIFVEERSKKMNYLIGASKYGRNKLVTAKFISMYLYIAFIYIILFVFNLLLYGAVYGFEEADCDIQSSFIFVNSNYKIKFSQLIIIMFILGIISCVTLGSCILAISARLSNTSSVMIASVLVVFAPVFFDFSSSLPNVQKLIEIMPIYLLNIKEMFMNTTLYFGKKLQIPLGISLSLLLSAIIWVWVHRYLKKNEVWSS
ncbi:hypothetical protein [Velocimicrobium porci]|uniref:ABC-2 type transporter transmembrane domain-containing protein n=1 Tax=Velocimicrobium porci TaxID=2606634 RepID=A0A6L5Y169_9FIRM|nr:hypothetical protein [Velocimicrobium porci]MSS64722.1 hypothetical protein [Velocimicrobium porci]